MKILKSIFWLSFILVGLLTCCFVYQIKTNQRIAFHADQNQAYYLYSIIAPFYDRIINPWHWTSEMRDESVRALQLSELQPNATILDAGAGTGFLTEGIVKTLEGLRSGPPKTSVVMLDQSPHQLEEAKRKQHLSGVSKILGDTHALPFPDQSFDRYASAGSVEYWPDPQKAINESYRVLREEGRATIIGPVRATEFFAQQLCDLWYLFPTADEYAEWFSKAGFVDVQIRAILPAWYRESDRQFGLIMGFIVTGIKKSNASSASPPLIPQRTDRQSTASLLPFFRNAWVSSLLDRVSSNTDRLLSGVCHSHPIAGNYICGPIAFALGGVGATYYLFLPMYLWLRNLILPGLLSSIMGLSPSVASALSSSSLAATCGGVLSLLLWATIRPALLQLRPTPQSPREAEGRSNALPTMLQGALRLSRPHTIRGTLLAICVGHASAALYTGESRLAEFAALLVSGLAMNFYIVALNQLTDVTIDLDNKPYLPIPAGVLSWDAAARMTLTSLVLALSVSAALSVPWFIAVFAMVIIGTVYSVPPWRFKENAVAAMICIALARGGIAITGGVAALLDIFGVSLEQLASPPLLEGLDVMHATWSIALLLFIHGAVIAIAKDIPDVAGDRKASVWTFAVLFSPAVATLGSVMLLITPQLYMLWHTVGFQLRSSGLSLAFRQEASPFHPLGSVLVHSTLLAWYVVATASHFGLSSARWASGKIAARFYAGVIWPAFYFQVLALPLVCLIRLPTFAQLPWHAWPGIADAATALSTALGVMILLAVIDCCSQRPSPGADRETLTAVVMEKIAPCVASEALQTARVIPPLIAWPQEGPRVEAVVDAARRSGVEDQALIGEDVAQMLSGIQATLGQSLGALSAPSLHFFSHPGKMIRCRTVLLLARLLLEDEGRQPAADASRLGRVQLLAQVVELEHTASLLHDDVIDGSEVRRGMPTVHARYGAKMAILTGDFLLATAVTKLTEIGDQAVIEAMSRSVQSLVVGEMIQSYVVKHPQLPMENMESAFGEFGSPALAQREPHPRQALLQKHWHTYGVRLFHKTASLFANACAAVAHIVGAPAEVRALCYSFGAHLGLAFQIIDDRLDFVGNPSSMGKPLFQDLDSGLATAPVLFAAEKYPEQVFPAIARRFRGPGDVKMVSDLVISRSEAIHQTNNLARIHMSSAIAALCQLKDSPARSALIQLTASVCSRSN